MKFIPYTDIKNKKTITLFFFITVLFYGITLKNKYALDDDYVTATNFPVKGQAYTPNNKLIKDGFSSIPFIWVSHYAHDNEGAFDYRPVVTTTFAIEYGIFGQQPFISHLINILLYFFTIWLFYCCLLKIFKQHELQKQIAFITALLFLIHPIHTEVVASLKSRDEILAFLFSLLFLNQFLIWEETKNIKHIFLAILFIFLGYFSKQTSILFFAVIPLVFFFYKKIDFKKIILLVIIFGTLFACFQLFIKYIITEKEVRNFYHFENPLFTEKVNFIDKIFIALKTLGFYIKMLIFPYHLKFYYGVNTFDFVKKINVYFFLALFSLASGIMYYIKSKNKDFLFSLLLFIGFSFPFLNFITPVAGILGERLTYFSSAAFTLLIATVIAPFFRNFELNTLSDAFNKKTIYITGITFICLIYVNSRNAKWYNKLTLFENDIPYLKESAKANSLLGNEYFEMLRTPNKKYSDQVLIQKCLNHYNIAVSNDSSFFSAYNNAGVVYYSYLNDVASAKKYFTLAIRHRPIYPQAYENLGNCYKSEKNITEAAKCYTKAIVISQKEPTTFIMFASLYFENKQYEKCLKVIKIAYSVFPNNYELTAQEANCLLMMGRLKEAIAKYEKAYQIFPNTDLAKYIATQSLKQGDTTLFKKYNNL
ncbi:MAG: tetratricopeptide repeat protein [Bacteroidetes bacterium]|nr:tetratricopeptide repeat protein [Bacteroidota bacterium]